MCLVLFTCNYCERHTVDVDDEGFCLACQDYFDHLHAQDQAEYESEREPDPVCPPNAKEVMRDGIAYWYTSDVQYDDYGAERYVMLWDSGKKWIGSAREAAYTDQLIGWILEGEAEAAKQAEWEAKLKAGIKD